MTDNEKMLLPCPFCACGDAYVVEDYGYCFALCTCSAQGPLRKNAAEAIAAWNTRAEPGQ